MPVENQLQDGDRWVFDESVADAFEDMLRRSIPDYDTMRELVTAVTRQFMPASGGALLDVGTSRGDTIAAVGDALGWDRHHSFVGVEVSEPMVEIACKRFGDSPYHDFNGGVTIHHHDIRDGIPHSGGKKFDVVTFVLTLMFIPVEYRAEILMGVRSRMRSGGALILVEKTLMGFGEVQAALTNVYHDLKRKNGYSDEEITRKAAALEGVQVPFTGPAYVDMLEKSGFEVEPFWRWGPFAGWVAVAS